MRFLMITFALLVGISPAMAATKTKTSTAAKVDPNATAFAEKVANAGSWFKLLTKLKGTITPLTHDELTALTKELPYPSVQVSKNGLYLYRSKTVEKLTVSNSDGERVTIVLKKNGAVSLNGKDWRIEPLAKVETEIKRIATFLDEEAVAKRSVLELVIPSAHAAPVYVTDLAAAAYASSVGWKSEACAGDDLDEELTADCSLMAVSMKGQGKRDPEQFLPVSLKCPSENKGTLELVSKNELGHYNRIRVTYLSGKPSLATLSVGDKQNPYAEILSVNFATEKNKDVISSGNILLEKTNSLNSEVCVAGSQEKERYFQQLSSNAASLRSRTSEDNSSEKQKVRDAT